MSVTCTTPILGHVRNLCTQLSDGYIGDLAIMDGNAAELACWLSP